MLSKEEEFERLKTDYCARDQLFFLSRFPTFFSKNVTPTFALEKSEKVGER